VISSGPIISALNANGVPSQSPRALETFSRQFLRRVDAEFAADGPAGAGLVTWSSTSARKRNQLREFPIFSELSKPSHSVSSSPRLIGLDAAWRGAAALPERHHPQCGEAFMNCRRPEFRMPPVVLAGLFLVQLASVAQLPNAWQITDNSTAGGSTPGLHQHPQRQPRGRRMASMKLQHASGEPVTFTYWYPGEPNNHLGVEDYATIRHPSEVPPTGSWNELSDTSGLENPTAPTFGVVELSPPGDWPIPDQSEGSL
jgi:hypothetical protein